MTNRRGARRPGPLGLEPDLHRTERDALHHGAPAWREAGQSGTGKAPRPRARVRRPRRRYRQLTTEELLLVLSDADFRS